MILFIDEIHALLNFSLISNIIKPVLARGDVKVIGATTDREWLQSTGNNPALKRRFEQITVAEPSIEDTTKIVQGSITTYENHYQAHYNLDVVNSVASLAKKYYPTRSLPDSALTLIDNVGSIVANRYGITQKKEQEYQRKSDELKAKLEAAKKIRYNETEITKLRSQLDTLNKDYQTSKNMTQQNSYDITISLTDLFEAIKEETGKTISQKDIDNTKSQKKRIAKLEESLKKKVIGQDEAISVVNKVVLRAKSGLTVPNKPLSVLAFFGPTGVGKTEVAK